MTRIVKALMLVVAVLSLTLSACSQSAESVAGGADGAPIKIGVIISTSGIYAGLGQPEVDALKAYEENQPEGLRRIDFVFENDQSDPAQAAVLARRLIADDSVQGLIAGATSAIANGIFPIVQAADIPWIVVTPNPYPNYNKEPFIFGPNLGPLKNHGQMHEQMLQLLGVSPDDTAVMVNDDASGQATKEAFEQFPNFVEAPASLTDYAPIVAAAKAAGRKAILNNQSGVNAGYVREAQVAAGLDIPFVTGPQVLTQSFTGIAQDASAGVDVLALRPMLSQQPESTDPEQAAAIEAYRKAFEDFTGRDPSLESSGPINVWDAALSFAHAATDADEISRETLQKQMAEQKYMGAGGEVARTADDHNGFQQDSWIYATPDKQGRVTLVAEMRDGKLARAAERSGS